MSLLRHLLQINDHAVLSDAIGSEDNKNIVNSLPLPIPNELETPERLEKLVEACRRTFGGISLVIKWNEKEEEDKDGERSCRFVVSDVLNSFTFIEATFWVRVLTQGKKGMTRAEEKNKKMKLGSQNREVIRLQVHEYSTEELSPLISIAQARSCVRSLVVGFGEYVRMARRRKREFDEIQRIAPPSCVSRDALEPLGTSIRLISTQHHRAVTISWTASFAVFHDDGTIRGLGPEEDELLVETKKLVDVEGSSSNVEKAATIEVFDTLVRTSGSVTNAAIALLKTMGAF